MIDQQETEAYLERGRRYQPPIVGQWSVPSTDEVRLAVYDLGGDGPALIISHATGFCGPVYGPFAEALADRYHCYAFDFRAHGHSTRPNRELLWDGMADDVKAVVDAVSPERAPYAVGHSMGGAALILAEVANPGLLRAIWAFEPILFPDLGSGRHPSFMSDNARRRRDRFDSRDDAYRRFGSKPPLNLFDPRSLRAYVDYGLVDADADATGDNGTDGGVVLGCRPEDEASVFEYHNSGAREAAGRLKIPCVVVASGDGGRPAEAVIDTAHEHDNLDLAVVDELTHFGHLQAPDAMADHAAAYFDSL